jgi:phosphopantetheinyl transferase
MDGRPESGPDRVVVWWSRVAGDERGQAGRLLCAAAASVLGVPAGDVAVIREPGHRPVLGGAAEGLHASLSHSRGIVAVALGRAGPVGVDVEVLRSLPVIALARRWFTAAEADWVADQPVHRRTRCFLTLWTGKEAMGKALGGGLRGGGLRRPVPVDAPPRFTVVGDLLLAVPATPADHVLAVACAGTGVLGYDLVER